MIYSEKCFHVLKSRLLMYIQLHINCSINVGGLKFLSYRKKTLFGLNKKVIIPFTSHAVTNCTDLDLNPGSNT